MERVRTKSSEKPQRHIENLLKHDPVLKKARDFAKKVHMGQTREDGSPYFDHLESVVKILYEEWGIEDTNMLSAGYLHDSVEDTELTLDHIRLMFSENGDDIAFLVDGVTQFLHHTEDLSKEERDHASVKKIFTKNLVDPRISVLKLADRLHNMRTLESMPPEKRVSKARETLQKYAKLAESLGMWKVMIELEDISLKYTHPQDYEKYSELMKGDPRTDSQFIGFMVSKLELLMKENDIKAQVYAQKNGIARLRHKTMRERRFQKVNDVVSFRIVILEEDPKGAKDNVLIALGSVWEKYREIQDSTRFDNFFYEPRDNGYSAIQATLDFPFIKGKYSIEVAISTKEKEEFNNDGVLSLIRTGQKDLTDYVLKLIFTPNGEVKFFRPEATGLDFAYHIEKHLGAQAKEIIIDGVSFPISTVIPNAATVYIPDAPPRAAPDPEAANFVLKPARKIIEEQIAEVEDQKNIQKGLQMVQPILQNIGLSDLRQLLSYQKYADRVSRVLNLLGCKRSVNTLYHMIGAGQLEISDFEKALATNNLTREQLRLNSVLIEGDDVQSLLGFIGETIYKFGGSVKPMTNEPYVESGEERFRTTFIVEFKDFPNTDYDAVRQEFLKNKAIKKVLIV